MANRISSQKPKPRRKKETLADRCAAVVGSWAFIGGQAFLLAMWLFINTLGPRSAKWDKPPFILLNLMLSFQAAFTGPVLLMASNRQSEIDRERDINHYLLDVQETQTLEEMALQLEQLHKQMECEDGECHW